jgi:hypothetical protein
MNVILDIAALLSALVWPAVLVFILYTYRSQLPGFFGKLVERVNKVDVAGISLELAQAKPLQPKWSAAAGTDLRHQATSLQITDSFRASFIAQLNDEGSGDFAEITLGSGREWLTSRLYIMAILFSRMKGLKCFVFVETANIQRRRYVGWAEPEKLRWSLAKHYPWLETAYADAYSEITGQKNATVMTSQGRLGYPYAPLEATASIDLLSAFLSRIQHPRISTPAAPPAAAVAPQPASDEVEIDGATSERARWLDAGLLERLLGSDLNTSCLHVNDVRKSDSNTQAKHLLLADGAFVAVVSDERRFEHLLRRDLVLEQVAKHTASSAPDAT